MKKVVNIYKRISAILLVVVYMMINIQPCFSATSQAYATKLINGSPILTGNWQNDEGQMSVNEAMALSVYMSNYAIPMYDNFESAFTKGGLDWGSKGEGLKYITFNDSDVVKENMQKIYDKVISVQTSMDLTETLLRRKNDDDTLEPATVEDLIKMRDYKYYITIDGSDALVLDMKDKKKYDRTLFACGFLPSVKEKSINDEVDKNIDNMKKNAVGLDRCGNIVVLGDEDKPNLILFPACLNPNLYNNYTINFVNNYMLTRIVTKDVDGFANFDMGNINIRDKTTEDKSTSWKTNTEFGIVLNHNVEGFWLFGQEGNLGVVMDKADADWDKQERGATQVINELFDYRGESLGNCIDHKNTIDQKNWGMSAPIQSAMKDAGVRVSGKGYIYAKTIYANYLLIAFRDDGKNGWNEKFFFDLPSQIQNAVTMEKLTQEDKVEAITDNVYSIVTDSKKASNFVINIFGDLLVGLYENLVNYEETRNNGNVQIFNVPKMGKNVVTGWFINILVNNLQWVIIIVMGLSLFMGMMNSDSGVKITDFLLKGFILSALIIIMPIIFNNVTRGYEDIINTLFQRDSNFYALNEDIKWESLMGSHANITDKETKEYLTMYNNLLYDTNSYIKYDQDKSPVVVDNATEEMMDILSSTVTGQMFLGSILRQYQSKSGNKDRTAGIIIDLYKKWFNVVALWDDTIAKDEVGLVEASLRLSDSAYANVSRSKTNGENLKSKFLSDSEKKLNWADYSSVRGDEEYKSYANRELGADLSRDTEYKAVVKTLDENGKAKQEWEVLYNGIERTFDVHKNFYLLDGLNLNNANKFENNLESSVSNNDIEAIKKVYNKLTIKNDNNASVLSVYNELDESKKINRNYGYMYLTENVSPYFYAVYYDIFGDKTVHDIGHLLMGGVVYDDSGNSIKMLTDGKGIALRDSVLVYHNKIRDFADLEELFTNVIPYCWRVMTISDKAFGDEKITEEEFAMYKGNPKRWLFDCNWIPKVMNTLNRSYGDIKVFSEVQGQANNKGEVLIQEFYKNLYPQMEQLINYVNMTGMTKDVLIRQMALITTIEFNKEFSSWLNELEPRKIDIGGASIDTVFTGMIANCGLYTSQQHSAGRNLANNGYGQIFLIIVAFLMAFLIPIVRVLLIGALFLVFYFNVIIIPVANKGVSVQSTMVMVVSCIIGLLKALILMSFPTIVLLFFARVDSNGVLSLDAYTQSAFVVDIGYMIKMFALILASIFSLTFGLASTLRHLGFKKDPFSVTGFSWDLGRMASMDSSGTLAGLGIMGGGMLALGGKLGGAIGKSPLGNVGRAVSDKVGGVVEKVGSKIKTNSVIGGDRIVTDNKTGQQEIKHSVFGGKGGFRDQMKRENRNMVYDENYAKRLEEKTKEKKEEKFDNK